MDLRLRVRAAFLVLLAMTAVKVGREAYDSIRPNAAAILPDGLYERFSLRADSAEYCLKSYDGYIAVYKMKQDRAPVSMTSIEICALRSADRAMLERGIPVDNDRQLLELLEDLGS